MPTKKSRLSRAERAKYLARAEDLQAGQVNCEIPDDWRENSHDLAIVVGEPEGNFLCELSSGVTAYAIWVRLVAMRSRLRLENCAIVSDWDSDSIVLSQCERGLYRVGNVLEFNEGEVLNHQIENGLRFHDRGEVAEGWLVANGLKPIPHKYRSWTRAEISLTFYDQFGNCHSDLGQAFVERSARVKESVSRVCRSTNRSTNRLEGDSPENAIWVPETTSSPPLSFRSQDTEDTD